MSSRQVQAVFFDLDGTLVDTAPDLGWVLNHLLDRHGLPTRSMHDIRPQASHGTQGLLKLGFGLDPTAPEFSTLRAEFLDLYGKHLAVASRPFPGVARLLDELDARRIPWGVVTNKPARYTRPLLETLGLYARACCVVSGDSCPRPKPAPEPMWAACRAVTVAPETCLYVGDAERDIQAAHAAAMPALVALYGYLAESDQPDTWGAEAAIGHPLELLDYPGLAT
ncbi:MAG: HAD family hydrolase [Pseudomonadota bacterium]